MKRLSLSLIFLVASLSVWADAILPVERFETKAGLRVYYVHLAEQPIIDLSLVFDAGAARDNPAKQGEAYLVNRLVNQGGNTMDGNAIADRFAKLGTIYFNDCGKDFAMVGYRSLSKYNDQSMRLFAQVLKEAHFPKQAFERERKIQLAEVAHSEQQPEAIADKTLFKTLYGKHAYANPVLGDRQTLQSIKLADLSHFYKTFYSNKNAKLIVVGDISRKDVTQLAETVSMSLSNHLPPKPLAPVKAEPHARINHTNFPAEQMQIRIAGLGISRQDPDYFPLMVGNYILGGGALVSRLTDAVREKQGLAYSVYSQFIPMKSRGIFLVSLATRTDQAPQALKTTRDVLSNFFKNGPTAKELEAAKKYLTGSFPLRMSSNRKIAELLLMLAFYDLPDDYLDHYVANIEAVSIDAVKEALKKHVNYEDLLTVTVGHKA